MPFHTENMHIGLTHTLLLLRALDLAPTHGEGVLVVLDHQRKGIGSLIDECKIDISLFDQVGGGRDLRGLHMVLDTLKHTLRSNFSGWDL